MKILCEETAKETGIKKFTKFEEKEEWDYKYEKLKKRMLKALRKYGKTKNDLYRIEYRELKKKIKNRKKERYKEKWRIYGNRYKKVKT